MENRSDSMEIEDGIPESELAINWPLRKKAFNFFVPAVIGFAITFGTSVYTPGIPLVMKEFGVSQTTAIVPLTTYTLGLGFGPLVGAPQSEILGRLGTYRLSVPLSMLFSIGAARAPNIAALSVLRFFAGMTGSAPLAVAGGTIADLFHPRYIGTVGACLVYAPFLGPSVGPVVGGFLAEKKGWRATQWAIVICDAFVWLLTLGLSETYTKAIEKKRNGKKGPKPPILPLLKQLVSVTVLTPLKMLLVEPIVALLSIYVAFNFAVLFTFFGAFPYVFVGTYRFTIGQSGLVFLGIALGCTLSLPTTILYDKFYFQKKWREHIAEGKDGIIPQEYRLWPAVYGSLLLPLSLFWFAWTAKPTIHWIVPALASIPFAWGNMIIFTCSGLYLMDTYTALTCASALAAAALLRFLLGATFPLFVMQMYHRLGIQWATSLLGFVSLAMAPIPLMFYIWGPQIRAKSSFETR